MHSKSDEKAVNPADAGPQDAPGLRRSVWLLAGIVAAEVALGSAVMKWAAPLEPPAASAVQGQAGVPMPAPVADGPKLPPAERVARWASRSGDAGGRPFVIVDKPQARVMAFDAQGRLQRSVPALLGWARGDDSVPGIGDRKMADIRPEERITPAGRFIARPGVNLGGEDIVWVDYDAAVSMHRVRATNPKEQRLQRLASPTADDNRISYGCINLPPVFYEQVLRPMVDRGRTVIYVLPDQRPLESVFSLGTSPQVASPRDTRHKAVL